MTIRPRRHAALAVLTAACLLLTVVVHGGTGGMAQEDADAPRLNVTTTTGQIADMVAVIGGDRVEVEGLMGPGVDPHLYRASEGDVARLSDADIIFYNGLNLEGRMGDLLSRLARDRAVVAVTEDIPADLLLEPEEFEGEADPHVWFDPTLWALAVERVQDVLAEEDPDHADTYRANADAYLEELAALDEETMERINTIPEERRVLVTAHDAFNYFGQRYNIEVVGIQGLSTDTEAGVDDIQRVADVIAEREIPAIFVETSVSPRTIEAVEAAVRDRGADVTIGGELFSDALGDPDTPEGTYLGMFRHNVETIVSALADPED